MARRTVAAAVASWLLCAAPASATSAPGRIVFGLLDAGATRTGAPRYYGASAVTALRDGRIVVAGTRPPHDLVVAELTADGAPDQPFGVAGFAWPSLPVPAAALQVLAAAETRLVVAARGDPTPGRPRDLVVVRLTAAGKGDSSFGQGGFAVLRGIQTGCATCAPATLTPDGRTVLAAARAGRFAVVRLTATGALDPTFADGGVATISGPGSGQAVAAAPDGTVVAAAATPAGGLLARLTSAGAPDPAFAGGEPVQIPFASPHQILLQPDGSLLVLGTDAPSGPARVAHYASDGTLDAGYGGRGVVELPPELGGARTRLLAQPDNQVLVVGGQPGSARVVRLTAAGSTDPALGDDRGIGLNVSFGGGELGRPILQNSFEPAAVAQRRDGSIVLAGEVHLAEPMARPPRYLSRAAIAVFTTAFTPDTAFGMPQPLQVAARVRARRRTGKASVRLYASEPGFVKVSLRRGSHTLARATLALFAAGARGVDIPFTGYGRRLLARHRRIRVDVRVAAHDLAGNFASARQSLHI